LHYTALFFPFMPLLQQGQNKCNDVSSNRLCVRRRDGRKVS